MLKKMFYILVVFYATAAHAVCPDGYISAGDVASIDDCYMEIAPGYYWTGSAVEICPAEYACTGGNMLYIERESEWGIVSCAGNTPTSYLGMAYCGCPRDPLDGVQGNYNEVYGKTCWKQRSANSGLDVGFNEYTTGTANCYWNGTNYALGGISWLGCDSYIITACVAGYWAPVTRTGAGGNIAINCVPVEAGYYSPEGSTERTACPDGLTTIGYGPGADEAADCGHALHMGDQTLHLRSEKRTSPALHVKIGDTTFYGDMSTESKGHLRVKIGDKVYSVFDDSV